MVHVDIYTAAYLLKVTTTALYRAIHRGGLNYFHDGKRYWIPLREVAERLGKTEEEVIATIRQEERLSALDINTNFSP